MNYWLQFYHKYPHCNAQDFIKLAYQAEFGCEHIMGDFVLGYIESELAVSNNADTTLYESISDEYCRVHLSEYKRQGYPPEVLAKCMQSVHSNGSVDGLLKRLDAFLQEIACGQINIDLNDAKELVSQYRQIGCPALHHSKIFRDRYEPHYRVIYRKHAVLLPVICAIEGKIAKPVSVKPLILAIDGNCGSGKRYYAKSLAEYFGACVIHCDDFFLPKEMRTAERLAEVGGNIHYERLRALLASLQQEQQSAACRQDKKQSFTYRAYNCSTDSYEERKLFTSNVIIVEGSYSLHPFLREFYDLKVLLTVDEQTQQNRLLQREGGNIADFVNKWIPLENRYFDTLDARNCIVIDTSEY